MRAAIQRLSTLQLIHAPAKHDGERLYIAHPFVRQVWRHGTEENRALSWSDTVEWAMFASERFGQDHNFTEIPGIRLRWPAIASVLRRLARSGDRYWKRWYLRIWRNCDAFLWTYGLWRERMELARVAVDFARDRDPDEGWKIIEELAQLEAHSLYNSIAKTQWHIDGVRLPADDSISDAIAIAHELGDNALLAQIQWYRARLLRRCRLLLEASECAKQAIKLAKEARDPYITSLALNGLGNIFADQGDRRSARKHYNRAISSIGSSREQWADELRAVVERNLGRLDLINGQPERALQRLEAAMDAEALIDAGDLDDAGRELAWAKSIVAHLGSALFDRIVEAAEAKLMLSVTQPS